MNNKITVIAVLTLVAFAALSFYTYGPGSKGHTTATVNPASLKPAPIADTSTASVMSAYHNRDFAENYYTIQFPQTWTLEPNQPGGYDFKFAGGNAKVETMDVPDNSTLELYVLSQDEPKLKVAIIGYKRVNYQKMQINGSDAFQLTYTSAQNGAANQTIRTYITGADKAGVITLMSDATQVQALAPTFASVLNSFRWEK
jgi:hypothetical protein